MLKLGVADFASSLKHHGTNIGVADIVSLQHRVVHDVLKVLKLGVADFASSLQHHGQLLALVDLAIAAV